MKKIAFSGLLVLFCVQIVLAQVKVEAPNWNVGDKWTSTDGMTIEVIGKDENSYTVRFQKESLLLERSTLNRIDPAQGKKRQAYKGAQRRLLNFPLMIGKSWKDNYTQPPQARRTILSQKTLHLGKSWLWSNPFALARKPL